MLSPIACLLRCSHLWTKLNSTTEDAAGRGRGFVWWRNGQWPIGSYVVLEIGPWIGLAGVCCEGASILCLLIIREVVAEVVVLGWVSASGRIIFGWEDIDGRSYSGHSSSAIYQYLVRERRSTYHSSNDQQDEPQAAHYLAQDSNQG